MTTAQPWLTRYDISLVVNLHFLFTSCINDSEWGGAQRRRRELSGKGRPDYYLATSRAYLGKSDPKNVNV